MKIRDSYIGTGHEVQIDFLDGAVRVILPNSNTPSLSKEPLLAEACVRPKGEELTEDQYAVLSCLDDTVFASKHEVMKTVGFSATKTARLLKELVAEGFAEATGSTKARAYRKRLPFSQ